jgi:hypothetical protein
MLQKFHEEDDIIALKLCQLDDTTDADVIATVVGGTFQAGDTVRLTAPTRSLDNRVKVLRCEREVNRNGNLATIDGEVVE